MKNNILKYSLGLLMLLFVAAGCTKGFEELNVDPNNPKEVPTINLISTAQKTLTDDMFDEWFSGRQGLLWSQFWAQRNYTDEDRFNIRQGTNNSYWRLLYTDMMDLQQIINIASDPAKAAIINADGDAQGQIAVANILKAYVFQLLASTYGDIPYEEAFDALNNPMPAYSSQKVIYLDLFAKLKAASDYLRSTEKGYVFSSGDLMYDGDPAAWAKFANSLRLKLAIRLSKVTDADLVAARTAAIADASTKAFTSNADNAQLTYLGDGQSNAPMYDGFYTSVRNDMTVTANFVDLLKGINDTLNPTKTANPFLGKTDPRLAIWVPKAGGVYRGMPYGIDNQLASALRGKSANLYNAQNLVLLGDASVVWMDYAEVCFILSELNATKWNQDLYEEGIAASMERWGVDEATALAYIETLPAASQATVLTQKYIALYMNGYEAWAEWRRTGYPTSLIQVGEKTGPTSTGAVVTFQAILGNAIPRRLTYPVQEFSINRENAEAAAISNGGNEFSTKLIWDK